MVYKPMTESTLASSIPFSELLRQVNYLLSVFSSLPPARLMDWRRLAPQFASFLGFLITVRYSFLIIHAVDQMQESAPDTLSTSFTVENEQLLAYYLAWTLSFLTMLLPPLIANSPGLMRLAGRAVNSLFSVFNPLLPARLMDFASFLGFLITVRYSFLIIHAVDQMQESAPDTLSTSFAVEHEQLLSYYLAWTLGFLTMLLPPLITILRA